MVNDEMSSDDLTYLKISNRWDFIEVNKDKVLRNPYWWKTSPYLWEMTLKTKSIVHEKDCFFRFRKRGLNTFICSQRVLSWCWWDPTGGLIIIWRFLLRIHNFSFLCFPFATEVSKYRRDLLIFDFPSSWLHQPINVFSSSFSGFAEWSLKKDVITIIELYKWCYWSFELGTHPGEHFHVLLKFRQVVGFFFYFVLSLIIEQQKACWIIFISYTLFHGIDINLFWKVPVHWNEATISRCLTWRWLESPCEVLTAAKNHFCLILSLFSVVGFFNSVELWAIFINIFLEA